MFVAFKRRLSITCVFRVDVELVKFIGSSLGESLSVDLHLAGVPNLTFANEDLEGGVCDVLPVLKHVNQVLANLVRCERNS